MSESPQSGRFSRDDRDPRGGNRRDDQRRDDRGPRGSERRHDDRRGFQQGGSRQAPSQRRRSTDPSRRAAYDVLREVAESDAYANLVLPPLLRQRNLVGRDAGFATELTYGTLRMRGRYDAILPHAVTSDYNKLDDEIRDILRLGAHQLLAMRVPDHAAVSESVGLARAVLGGGAGQLVNAVLRRVAERTLEEGLEIIGTPEDESARAATAALARVESHPEWVVRALQTALVSNDQDVAELPALLAAQNQAPKVTLVARPGLIDRDALAETLKGESTPGRWTPTALVLETPGDTSRLGALQDGLAGVQDEGSQLVAWALANAPLEGTDTQWLDMCAGPGGKAALLAALAAQRGAHLVANEFAPHRADLVRRSLSSLPDDAYQVEVGDGQEIGALEPGKYDRILVDAPCTGLGALRRRPEARWRRSVADLAGLSPLQRGLLLSALQAVRVGGLVAYVTCSPHVSETQLVVADILRKPGAGIEVEQVDARAAVQEIAGEDIPLADRQDVQLWPHIHGTDAMYLALLRRTA